MHNAYTKVTRDTLKSHLGPFKTGEIALRASTLELPTPGVVRSILDMFPGFRLMNRKSGLGDIWLTEFSDYVDNIGNDPYTDPLTLANAMVDPATIDDDTPIRMFDPVVFLRTDRERKVICKGCRGKGSFDCGCEGKGCRKCDMIGRVICDDCGESQGFIDGTMVTVALDRDDYFWVSVTNYNYSANVDMDWDFGNIRDEFYRCDQMSGLASLAASQEFRELVRLWYS